MAVRVDRCVCTNRTFAELLALARANDLDLAALRERTGAGAQCGLCAPYLAVCLRDGVTTFDRLLPPPSSTPRRP